MVVSVDARDGYVAVNGWTKDSRVKATDLIGKMVGLGVQRFMYTDIGRDGTLTEPNFDAIQEIIDTSGHPILAAGGVSAISHVLKLAELGVEGAIAGTALYTDDLNFKDAINALEAAVRGKPA